MVVIAECQTAGRGRLGRTWHSPPGLGLYVSVLLRPRRPATEIPRWALAASVAACLSLREAGAAGASVEWPNDIVCGDRKIGGTLVEARGSGAVSSEIVIGTGINVGHEESDFPEDLRATATSLRMAAPGRRESREAVALSYLERLGGFSAELASGDFERTRAAWLELAPRAGGSRVRVAGSGGAAEYLGWTRGIDATGALLVEGVDGLVRAVRATGSVTWLEA